MKRLYKQIRLINGEDDLIIDDAYFITEEDIILEVGVGEPAIDQTIDEVINLHHQFVLPGLIDCHVHLVWDGQADPQTKIDSMTQEAITLLSYKNSMDYLKIGITAVRDLASPGITVLSIRDAINEGLLSGPTIIASGPALTMTGGHVHAIGLEADGEANIMKATRQLLKSHVDVIKLMATGGIYTKGEEPGSPQLTIEELRVAVSEAHKKNKKVAAHAQGLEGIMNCIKVGVDTIEHGIYADEFALRSMKENGIALVPTMIVMKQLATDPRVMTWAQEKAKNVVIPHEVMLEKAIQVGVKIATGTDCGSPVTPPHLYFDEMIIMHEAGMSTMEVIKSSTSIAAEVIDLQNHGKIKPGYKADFLVCKKNPIEDLSILKENKDVYKNGVKIT